MNIESTTKEPVVVVTVMEGVPDKKYVPVFPVVPRPPKKETAPPDVQSYPDAENVTTIA